MVGWFGWFGLVDAIWGSFGDVGTYLPIEKGAKGEVGISVSGWIWGGMETRRIDVQQGLGPFVK